MNFSKMDKRIEFVYKGPDTDEDGYSIKNNWISFRKCWASIKGLRGKTFYTAAQTQSENNKVFNCRYFKGLTENMKIKYNGNLYDITSINDLDEKHIEYEIHAKEVK